MTQIESGKGKPHGFGIIEIGQNHPSGLERGDYLLTDIPVPDWVRHQKDLNSQVRLKLALWAQEISTDINEPFSLTFAAQSETGLAIFKITLGRIQNRDVYWFDPERHPTPPIPETRDSVRHIIIDPDLL